MRQEVYRVAFDEASAELSEILNRFEQLRSRKDRVEKVVEALKPLLAGNESPAPALSLHAEWAPASVQTPTSAPVPIHTPVQVPVAASVPVSVPVQAPPPPPPAPMPMAQQVEYAAASIVSQAPASLASAPIPYPVQQAVDETNDPFARRAETSVGLGSATRDVREYSRLFQYWHCARKLNAARLAAGVAPLPTPEAFSQGCICIRSPPQIAVRAPSA